MDTIFCLCMSFLMRIGMTQESYKRDHGVKYSVKASVTFTLNGKISEQVILYNFRRATEQLGIQVTQEENPLIMLNHSF